MTDYYKTESVTDIIDSEKAINLLRRHGIEIDQERESAVQVGLQLGYLTLRLMHQANDYTHGPFETSMLLHNGIVVDQPNPLDSYTIYHVIENEGTIESNE